MSPRNELKYTTNRRRQELRIKGKKNGGGTPQALPEDGPMRKNARGDDAAALRGEPLCPPCKKEVLFETANLESPSQPLHETEMSAFKEGPYETARLTISRVLSRKRHSNLDPNRAQLVAPLVATKDQGYKSRMEDAQLDRVKSHRGQSFGKKAPKGDRRAKPKTPVETQFLRKIALHRRREGRGELCQCRLKSRQKVGLKKKGAIKNLKNGGERKERCAEGNRGTCTSKPWRA